MSCSASICHCKACGTSGKGDRDSFLVRLVAKEAEKKRRIESQHAKPDRHTKTGYPA